MAVVFASLLAFAYLVRAPLDEVANPADASYVPRPEWYFLSLFQLLKYFPGPLEPVATQVIPGLAVGFLALLPFLDRTARAPAVGARPPAVHLRHDAARQRRDGADVPRPAGPAAGEEGATTGGCCRLPAWSWRPGERSVCRRCHVGGGPAAPLEVDGAPARRGVAAQSHDRSRWRLRRACAPGTIAPPRARWAGLAPRPSSPTCGAQSRRHRAAAARALDPARGDDLRQHLRGLSPHLGRGRNGRSRPHHGRQAA